MTTEIKEINPELVLVGAHFYLINPGCARACDIQLPNGWSQNRCVCYKEDVEGNIYCDKRCVGGVEEFKLSVEG